LNDVVNSEAFREKVFAHRGWRCHEGLDSEQIYNRLMTGDRGGKGDLMVERTVSFDYTILPGEGGRVVGYRLDGTNDIFTYRRDFERMDAQDLASHLGHEILGHLAGEFGHPVYDTRRRRRSVPYTIDGFISDLLDEE
ncbi:MAG: hypothetical protein KC457_19955, partial [Myxococcales bacterium]|nr:hypothetical protein [Myxococcales bacterium]